jgi:hypothetical protein
MCIIRRGTLEFDEGLTMGSAEEDLDVGRKARIFWRRG